MKKKETNGQETDLQNEKDYFASILSHDLRSPLSSVILLTSYIKTKPELTDTLPYIELIEQSAKKELGLMTTLLALMRAGSPLQVQVMEELDPGIELQDVISNLQKDILQKQVTIDIHLSENLRINTDRQIFVLVLKNLLKHSLHFSSPGQQITVYFQELDSAAVLEINFISEEVAQKDPESFFSSSHLVTAGPKGFPEHIDLYFCRKLISDYSGTIHAEVDKLNNACRLIMTLIRQVI